MQESMMLMNYKREDTQPLGYTSTPQSTEFIDEDKNPDMVRDSQERKLVDASGHLIVPGSGHTSKRNAKVTNSMMTN